LRRAASPSFHGSIGRRLLVGWTLISFHLLVMASAFPADQQARPSTILISVDTLRADHLSCYGYKELRTRHIDAIRKGGALFAEVNSHVPLTLPSHQGPNHNLLDLSIGDLAGRSGSRLVIESFQASLQKSGTPLAHHAQRAAQFLRHASVLESLGAGQHHPRPPSQRRLATRAMGQRLNRLRKNAADLLSDSPAS